MPMQMSNPLVLAQILSKRSDRRGDGGPGRRPEPLQNLSGDIASIEDLGMETCDQGTDDLARRGQLPSASAAARAGFGTQLLKWGRFA